MEHHSSYSAPRSSRASGRTRSTASRQDQRRTHKPQKNGNTGFSRILLCYILPFLVVNLAIFFIVTATPKIEIDISDTTDYKTLDVSFKIHSLLPLKKMTTTLESQPIEFKKEKGVYHAVLESNGTLEIYALSLNGMQAQDIEHIAVLDDTAPSFDEENVVMENGKLILTIEDSISGINYDSIYATDDSGTKILPDSCDKENGEVTFKLEEGSLTVYVEDMAGNPNQAAFSINQSGINTSDRNSKFPTDGKNGMNGTEATEAENETKASEAKTSETKASETKSAKASSTKAETKASSAAKSTTAATLLRLNPPPQQRNLPLERLSPPLQRKNLLLQQLSPPLRHKNPLPQRLSPPLRRKNLLLRRLNPPLRRRNLLLLRLSPPQKQQNLLQRHMNQLQRKLRLL